MAHFFHVVRQLPLALVSPLLALLAWLTLSITDLVWAVAGRRRRPADTLPDTGAASVVIPNWNGRDLLEKYLPSVVEALAGNPRNEVIVVENGSTDGSAEFVRERFPEVRLLALEKNLGFGGGSTYGFRQARNDIVVLLNSDMRVDPGFLQPLLDGFADEKVFAVACQIFFSDPNRPREETGLTQAWWAQGALRVRHREDPAITGLYPCFYGGGGSCAFDRRKLLELGGFDEMLRPFYLEDTDLGYLAWKRGWKVLYQPASRVWHEHRGTIGRNFSRAYIDSVIQKNRLLFAWKNIHDLRRFAAHFAYTLANALLSLAIGESAERASLAGLGRAFLQLPAAMRARWRARSLAVVDDCEAFRRPLGGYFLDRFTTRPASPERLSVLFVSPYPVCPPIHGGGVFMNQTLRELGRLADVHLLALLDAPGEADAHEELRPFCASMEFVVRLEGQPKRAGSILPYSVREFTNDGLEWIIHRILYSRQVDILQLEYTNMGQYGGVYRQLACVLFEHDVYFQSIGRGLRRARPSLATAKAFVEYLRALRYELRLLPAMDRIQTCSAENKRYLLGFLPALRDRIDDHVRAGIDTARYDFRPSGREPFTILFLGSFRHLPNLEALHWFLGRVMPEILRQEPRARLLIAGSDPPADYTIPNFDGAVQLLGFVDDVREALARYTVFVCPILTGSGVRVKLLEAFAAGIPVVSTRLGAEGLSEIDGEICALADAPGDFAAHVVELLDDPQRAEALARAARDYVVAHRDMAAITLELERTYRWALAAKRT
jgi:GT2 family glycosyltransferase/glycosyltransferase involved in cell wall biosynthesis